MKKTSYFLLLLCAALLVSCGGMFAPRKGEDVSCVIDLNALLKSARESGTLTARGAAAGGTGREAGDDGSWYVEGTLTTQGKTQTVRVAVPLESSGDENNVELAFSNVPSGGSAHILIELYYFMENNEKKVIFRGRGTIDRIVSGPNAVAIHAGRTDVDVYLQIELDAGLAPMYLSEDTTDYAFGAVGNVLQSVVLSDDERLVECSADGAAWRPLRTDSPFDLRGRKSFRIRVTALSGDQKIYNINIRDATPIMLPDFQFDPSGTPTSRLAMKWRSSLTAGTQSLAQYDNVNNSSMSNFAFDADGNAYFALPAPSGGGGESKLVRIDAKTGERSTLVTETGGNIISVAVSRRNLYYLVEGTSDSIKYRSLANLEGTPGKITFTNFNDIKGIAVNGAINIEDVYSFDTLYLYGKNSSGSIFAFLAVYRGDPFDQSISDTPSSLSIVVDNYSNSPSAGITDMVYFEGSLWFLVADSDTSFQAAAYNNRGKLVKFDLPTPSTFGGTAAPPYHPVEADPQNAFLNPVRFIGIMPKKLIIADDGAYGTRYQSPSDNDIVQKNRIIAVDTDSGAMSVQPAGVEFFNFVTGSGTW